MKSLLNVADDLILLADLDRWLVFPDVIVLTSLQPDIVMYSMDTVIMVELEGASLYG